MSASLNASVLVLNRLWQAVNVCSARRALCLLFQGHAQVVHAEGDGFNTFDFHGWREISQHHMMPTAGSRRSLFASACRR